MFKTDKIVYIQDKLKGVEGTVVVEGIRDKRALTSLGFKNIFDISGKNLHKVVDQIKVRCSSKYRHSNSVIILTDFDKEGKRKASTLTKLFQASGVKVNSFIRNKIKQLFKIHKIEEFNSFTKLLEDGYYGKTCSIYDKIFNRSRFFCRWNSGKARRDRCHIRSDRRPAGF